MSAVADTAGIRSNPCLNSNPLLFLEDCVIKRLLPYKILFGSRMRRLTTVIGTCTAIAAAAHSHSSPFRPTEQQPPAHAAAKPAVAAAKPPDVDLDDPNALAPPPPVGPPGPTQ